MSNVAMHMDVKGLLPLKQQLQLLAMPKQMRRRLLSKTARKVISDSKKRVRNQVDLNGMPFEARAKKRRGGRKMLAKLSRQLTVLNNTGEAVVVGFKSAPAGFIGGKQQHGFTQQMSARALSKQEKAASKESPATRKQAIALREAGFEIKKANGKGKKKPTLKWFSENFTVGQAGAILRDMREKAGETIKTTWTTVLPARSFLGASASEVTSHIETIFNQMKQEIAHVAR